MSERIKAESAFNLIADILETVRFKGTVFFSSNLAAPWGVDFPAMDCPRFHIAVKGDFSIGTADQQVIRVKAGDIGMVANGQQHWLADKPGRTLESSELAAEACDLGRPMFQQGELSHRLICGLVRFDSDLQHPMLSALPPLLCVHSDQDPAIANLIALIDLELTASHGGSSQIIDRLAEILFLRLLDCAGRSDESSDNFLSVLRDRRMHHALALIHKQPEVDWSLSDLGEAVGMSRATLVRRFKEIVGVAPMAYLANWRMTKAHSLIKYSNYTIDQIAELVGFASAKSFSRAFKRLFKQSPKALRKVS
ncbi:MAG: AraC family transcriptional regulator [Pseudomonadota bacterium]